MSKKQEVQKEEIKPAQLPAAVTKDPLQALVTAGASNELLERIGEVQVNVESIQDFRLPRMKMTSSGVVVREGDDAIMEIDFIILHAMSFKQYYSKPYRKDDPTPPDCFSKNGVVPDADSENVQSPRCKGCKQNEFGTNTMGEGKACRDLKPLYVLMLNEDGENSIIPRQLTITPTSLRAANAYLTDLTERGVAFWKVKTKIIFTKKDKDDTYVIAGFKMVEKISDEAKLKDVKALRDYWMPVMTNQSVEAENEAANTAPAAPVDTKGEF